MSRQDGRDKGSLEKIKNFFRSGKPGLAVSKSRSEEYVVLTDDLASELRSSSALSIRLRVSRDLLEQTQSRRLESYTVEKLWTLLKDLLEPEVPKEARHLILTLFASICRNQVEKSGAIRAKFFAFIQFHDVPEDSGPRFEFLKALTENGRDISHFNEKIGPFLKVWMSSSKNVFINTKDSMSFLVNIIKFNQSFLDSDVLDEIIQNVCFICCTSSASEDVLECLQVLSAVICYPSLPQNSLQTFLATLCRTVNVEPLCQASWKIMRDLLGTHMGHSGLLQMCEFMETADVSEEVAVIRGAVFFVGAVLWGNRMLRSLKYSPSTVLAAFEKALERKHPYVSYEVIIRVQDLVRNKGDTLLSVSWDLVLEIIRKVLEYTRPEEARSDGHVQKIVKCVNETLDVIDEAIDAGGFSGSTARFYAVVDAGCKFRLEASVCKLLQYKMNQFLRTTRPGWFNNLIGFAERHYRLETRPSVKVLALSHITSVCLTNRDTHEEDLIEKVIFPFMKNLETENDLWVRQQGVNFIVEFMLDSTSKKGHDLLHILEKIVNRPFESASSDLVNIISEKEVVDVYSGIKGLIKIFKRKIYHLPSSVATLAYNIIVRHLTHHYKKPAALEDCHSIRLVIFECFFKIRANSMYLLGFPDPAGGSVVNYCSYLAVDHRDGELVEGQPGLGNETPALGNTSSPSASTQSGANSSGTSPGAQNQSTTSTLPVVTYISLTQACKLVVSSLKKEKDWRVLELILRQIPYVMENKALILSKHGNDIDYLANAVCTMMMDKSFGFPDTLRNLPPKFQRSDLQSYLYPILTALVSYHSHLDSTAQLNIVKCLEHGLVSRNPRICILALSTCTLEMKDTMHKLLPQVLLALSKITPKVNIAIPVLEFLSTLIHLPRVFASFVQDQYMSIFAIALPYTNPFKFNQYTVSLAHHVISMWFLKCRLSFRKGFVSYIIKGLEANVWTPYEEETRRNALELQNEDSSNRKRSSSLTEQSNKRRERITSGHSGAPGVPPSSGMGPRSQAQLHPDVKPIPNKALLTFHQELTETCVDLMARYAFADCSALPTRFPSTDFLLTGGHSQTWLIDNKIIRITTSGCTQKELRDGLCDKCWLLCRKPSPALTTAGSEEDGGEDKNFLGSVESHRRRHQSAFAGSRKNEEQKDVDGGENKAKDDLHLEHKLQLPQLRNTDRMDDSGTGGIMSDRTSKQKSDHMLCNCWCQGWAEIHIRRPTGNTSWMMRVQNQIGNHAGADLPLRELSAMFLRNPNFDKEPQSQQPSGIPSGNITPANHASIPSSSHGSPTHTPLANPLETWETPSTPPSPKSPPPGSPTEAKGIPVDPTGRTLVRRSNSSPEMSDTLKPGFITQQNLIQEQDEDELSLSSKSVLENASSETNLNLRDDKQRPEETPTPFKAIERPPSHLSKGGSTSPYRRSYEAIPEEVSSQKDTVHPLLSASPSRREKLMAQHSVDDTLRSKVSSGRDKVSTDIPPVQQRDRTFTISVMSPAVRNKGLRRILSAGSGDSGSMTMNRRDFESRSGTESSNIRSGMSPSFVFLQLCAQGMFGPGVKPFLISPIMEKSIKVLDYIQPFETHKIGVVYVGPGQANNEAAILQNMYGSSRFRDFLQGLGTLVKLRGVDPQKIYIGGLSTHGDDGEFAIIWQDDVMQVMFHVPTLMPNKENDPACNFKKRHIGNDYVCIVYNNSGEEFDISTIRGQFNYACVVVEPLDHGTNRVLVKAKPVLAEQIGHNEPKIVSDQNLPIMSRQLALHSNLASVIFQAAQQDNAAPYASNWLERLRKIKQLRNRLTQELGASAAGNSDDPPEFNPTSSQQKRPFTVDDFTEYV